jgi:hypothetical protein
MARRPPILEEAGMRDLRHHRILRTPNRAGLAGLIAAAMGLVPKFGIIEAA